MKPIAIKNQVGLDRLATRNEVYYALSFSAQGALELIPGSDDSREMDSDLSGHTSPRSEDKELLEIVSEMLDSEIN